MKNTFKYLFGTLALAGAMVACSPEEFDGMSESGIVQTSQYKDLFEVSVDQTINQVTVNFKGASEVYPVWELHLADGKVEYSTAATLQRIIMLEGDYSVKCYIGNRHGISKDCVELPFHINESIIDYTKYYTLISKGTWYMDNNAVGHIACGPTLEDPTGWWKAGVDEKAAFGVYDNALTFSADGKYGFDPGAAGTIYANKCVSKLNTTGATEDFTVPMDAMTTSFEFKAEGEDLYILFPGQTPFPYIASDQIWDTPRYKVVSLTAKAMTLASFQITNDNPDGIGWQYILTTQHEVKEVFNGFTYDQPNNIWKNIEVQAGGIYYADGGWTPYPDNGGATFTVTNQETNVVLPLATASQWQAQFPIHTNVGPGSEFMTSSKHYDFSCVITSNQDLNGMTLKLVETGDNGVPGSLGIAYDANAVFYDNSTNLKAFEDYVFYLVDQPGVDIQDNVLQLVLDFGGCAEGTEVTIKDIVLIDHALNTELDKVPGNEPSVDPEKPSVDWTGENLLAGMPIEITQWYAPGWNQIADAEYTAENGVYTITYPESASDQWMAQFTFNNTGIALDPEKSYDFRIKLTSTTDHPGVTIKLTQQDDDNTYITADRHALEAFEETWIELSDLKFVVNGEGKGVINNLKMPFDFGGIAAGTIITMSDMHLQEHKAGAGSVTLDYNSDANLWKAVDAGERFLSVTPWFSPEGWGGGLNPEWSHEGNVWNVTLPDGMGGSQWMGQFPINTTLSAAQADKYTFSCTIEADMDLNGVTIKLTETDEDGAKHDDNFFCADRHDVEAYEPFVYTITGAQLPKNDAHALSLFFDFGGSPVGANVQISNIILIKE